MLATSPIEAMMHYSTLLDLDVTAKRSVTFYAAWLAERERTVNSVL